MDVERFRELLEAGRVRKEVSNRRARVLLTSYIVQNIGLLVNQHNKKYGSPLSHFCGAFRAYNRFMKFRRRQLEVNGESYVNLLKDQIFCQNLRALLRKWNAFRPDGSSQRFQSTIAEAGQDFDLLRAKIRLETFNPRENETANSVIRWIFNLFARQGSLKKSGGVMVASKTMHFIMPELFIMIDNRIKRKLHEICDYAPHREDGRSWDEVIPDFYEFPPRYRQRLNPPIGDWDYYGCYIAALMYYKRVIHEWCEKNKSNIQGFLNLDPEHSSTPARIIDKALW